MALEDTAAAPPAFHPRAVFLAGSHIKPPSWPVHPRTSKPTQGRTAGQKQVSLSPHSKAKANPALRLSGRVASPKPQGSGGRSWGGAAARGIPKCPSLQGPRLRDSCPGPAGADPLGQSLWQGLPRTPPPHTQRNRLVSCLSGSGESAKKGSPVSRTSGAHTHPR